MEFDISDSFPLMKQPSEPTAAELEPEPEPEKRGGMEDGETGHIAGDFDDYGETSTPPGDKEPGLGRVNGGD